MMLITLTFRNLQDLGDVLSMKQKPNPFVKEFRAMVEDTRAKLLEDIESAEARL
jgi:hypothetical protein